MHRRVFGQFEGARDPGPAVEAVRHGAALDIAKDRRQEAGAGDRDILDRLAQPRRVDQHRRRVVRVGQARREIKRHQRPRREIRPPILFEREHQLARDKATERRAPGDRQPHRRADRTLRGQESALALEKIDLPVDEDAPHPSVGVAQHARADADVIRGPAKNLDGGIERHQAVQRLQNERIARCRHRPRAPIARDDQGVGVKPGGALLPLGEAEPVFHECPCGEVELAPFGGILAAIGEADHAPAIVRRQNAGALEHPVAPFRGGERIDIDERPPFRLRGRERGKARPTPQAPDMHIVLPEIGKPFAEEPRIGDAVGRGDDRQRRSVHRRIARVGFEEAKTARVLRADPAQRRRALNLLQPQKRIVGHSSTFYRIPGDSRDHLAASRAPIDGSRLSPGMQV